MTRTTLLSAAATFAILELILIWLVWTGRVETFDFQLRLAVLALDPPSAVKIWRIITFLGSGIFITALTLVSITILAARAEWQAFKYLTAVMIGAVGMETGLKLIVHRSRPDEVFANTMPSSYSFPSGHALFAMAFYSGVAMIFVPRLNAIVRPSFWVVAVLLIILIGASRIFLGVHYPTDVLGGYIVAAFWLIVVQLLLPPNRSASG